MTRIADLELMTRTAELGSLTAAARALDWSPAAASAAVKRLEQRWGVPLFVRSTRSLRLSPEGERVLPAVQRALAALQEAQDTATAQRAPRTRLRGELQIAMPSDLGRNLLLPWLEEFQQQHPQLALRLHFGDRNTDLLRAPVDAAVRYGAPRHATQVALPLLPGNRQVLVAAPDYLARHGAPATPEALGLHEALRFMQGERIPDHWRLQVEGRWREVPVQGRHSCNDGEVVKRWALAGVGIACKSWLDVVAELDAGRLQWIQPHWRGADYPLQLVLPGRGQITPAVRALRELLAARMAPLARRLAEAGASPLPGTAR